MLQVLSTFAPPEWELQTLEPGAEILAVPLTILKLVEGGICVDIISELTSKDFKPRYSVIGINSFNSDPDVFTKVTPELKNWIVSIVTGAMIADPASPDGCSRL